MRLGVNIDHVATVRQARRIDIPDPVAAAVLAELAGAEGITVHLREDRRHIQDRDVRLLRETIKTKMNLELANVPEMVEHALRIVPEDACLVPEKREEVTTEGGLDVAGNLDALRTTVEHLKEAGITVSMFVDPIGEQLEASAEIGADYVELHTGTYAEATTNADRERTIDELAKGYEIAMGLGLGVNAGHGLNYRNVQALVRRVPGFEELNIGHAIVARAVLVGMERAVREMKDLIREALQG